MQVGDSTEQIKGMYLTQMQRTENLQFFPEATSIPYLTR